MGSTGWGVIGHPGTVSRGWRLIGAELRHRARRIALGVAVAVIWALSRVFVPYLVKVAIDRGIGERDMGALVRWTGAVVALGAVSAACAGGRRYLAFREARLVEADLRDRLFVHIQGLDFAFFDRSSSGDLLSRANSDLLQIQSFLNMIPFTLGNGLQILAAAVILVTLNPLLALCALATLPLVNVLGRRFSLRLHPSMQGIQRASARVAAVVEETVAGTRVVKGLGAEPVQQARLETEAGGLYDQAMTAVRTRSRYTPVLELLPNLGLLAVVAVGGHMVINGSLSLGSLVAFNVYVNQLIWPIRSLGFVIALGQRAVASAERVAEVLDTEAAVAAPAEPQSLPASPRGEVRFEAVRFAYPPSRSVAPARRIQPEAPQIAEQRAVLDHLDLVIHPGETVALVGATGSGKSTVPRLLARFYDVTGGRVLLDGVDVRHVPLPELRRAVGIVFEESFLFTDSIAANIAFARPDADDATIRRAAEAAGADEFVDALADGYDTEVGERGYSLSGGQRQRLAIARALVAQPRVLVLDDATSAIDPAKEQEILDGLAIAAAGCTTLVISHRPATIALADRVIFLDGGRVAATGTHDELLATTPRYGAVLAAALSDDGTATRHRRRRGGGLMWIVGGVADDEKLDAAATRHVIRRTAALLGPHRRLVAIAAAMAVGYVSTQLAGPYLVRVAIDHGVLTGRERVIWAAVAAYAGVAVLNYVFARRQILAIGTLGETFLRDLRLRLFAHLQRLGLDYHDRHPTGVIVSRLTSDVDSMQELVQQGLQLLVANLLLVALALVLLAIASPVLALSCFVFAPVLIWSSRRFKRQSNDAYLAVRDRIGAMLARLSESLNGVRVIQAYTREPVEIERFSRANRSLLDAHMQAVKAQSWYLPTVEGCGVATTALAVGFGGWLVLHDRTTVGVVAFFVLTLNQLFEPIQQLSQLFNVVQSAGAALHKLYDLLDTEPAITEAAGAVELPATGDLTLDDVGFAYGPDAPAVLAGVSLTVRRGERLALVGPTGAGKSTVAKLAARLYDPVTGTVTYGGTDLRRATLDSIRARIVLAPQEGFLFAGTLRDNLRIGRPGATDAEIETALDRLGILDRFQRLEDGLDTQVQERGSRLSAGEKQLVSLARAALVDPPVLILDEATSSLDPGTEVEVEAALERLSEGRTVIVIAHRLSSAARADRVAVIDGGHLVEVGTHAELVAADGRYAALFAAWLAGAGAAYGGSTA